MEAQLRLDLSRHVHAEDGNSLVPVSTRIPGMVLTMLEAITKRMNKHDKSKLIAEYVIEGVMRDFGTIAATDLHSNESLKTILAGK